MRKKISGEKSHPSPAFFLYSQLCGISLDLMIAFVEYLVVNFLLLCLALLFCFLFSSYFSQQLQRYIFFLCCDPTFTICWLCSFEMHVPVFSDITVVFVGMCLYLCGSSLFNLIYFSAALRFERLSRCFLYFFRYRHHH
ncbi:hypothetical protein, unlikely [Trypanosoma brucei gambiense DAL972]|uniref:Uncharacterized protein n=1 Tax=Trypanosoma brucei gambiense (strain MHOM/CI/86/DAL972) TaxID=679716 RepID=C9ZJB0_TRYB9|nr:hypothetical protein, unlikely [Trypanosoma brucei gambiense DAL972]CBH09469.1 hypothetical protein, unlikely [Trypanosoma brucei gambiense DAL972]|eukprot:XP_011771774.1 hypothetical protein, unlikely [Trypanosoma brucei gambiense DAL972]